MVNGQRSSPEERIKEEKEEKEGEWH